MALELVEGEPRRLDEVAVVVLLDQVGDGLGVGLGGEDVTCCAQALAQLAVVLDDPVEHDRQLCGIVAGERVRVLGVTPPCVAQRVWPRPVVAGDDSSPAASFRFCRFPTARV